MICDIRSLSEWFARIKTMAAAEPYYLMPLTCFHSVV